MPISNVCWRREQWCEQFLLSSWCSRISSFPGRIRIHWQEMQVLDSALCIMPCSRMGDMLALSPTKGHHFSSFVCVDDVWCLLFFLLLQGKFNMKSIDRFAFWCYFFGTVGIFLLWFDILCDHAFIIMAVSIFFVISTCGLGSDMYRVVSSWLCYLNFSPWWMFYGWWLLMEFLSRWPGY